jgi:hypothetical protein
MWRFAVCLIALVITGDGLAQSQQPSPVQGPAEQQTENNGSAESGAPNKPNAPGQPPAVIPQVPTPILTGEKTPNASPASQQPENWWQKFLTDPNAGFAGAVALFTLALVVVGSRQNRQLKRSVDLLAQSERAQMFMIVTGSDLTQLTRGVEGLPDSAKIDDGVVDAGAYVLFCFKNYGKTPAIVKEMSFRLVFFERLPDEPIYIPSDIILLENMISTGNITGGHECKLETKITLGQARTIIRAQSYVWFYGHIIYDDIFGKEHEHAFIWRYGGAHGFRPNYEHPKYIKNT